MSRTKEQQRQYYLEHRGQWRQYYLKHRKQILLRHKERKLEHRMSNNRYYGKLKQAALTHYGNGKCTCVKCGFANIKALSIDHINGDGAQARKMAPNKIGRHFYVWLKQNNYPKGYQTLCMNCQFIKKIEKREF